MNRKLITNLDLKWPDISQETSEKITNIIEQELTQFKHLKRLKNPSKKVREKLKKVEKQEITNDETHVQSKQMKHHFIFGINSITKYLEKVDPKDNGIICLLVCRSCKPLLLLTKHLLVIAAARRIPASCLFDLSPKLAKIFNFKSAHAVMIVERSIENEIIKKVLLNFKQLLVPLLPQINDPFIYEENKQKFNDIKLSDKPVNKVETRSIEDILVFNEEYEETPTKKKKLSEFISFNETSTSNILDKNLIDFNSRNFIVYDSIEMDVDEDFNEKSFKSKGNDRYFIDKQDSQQESNSKIIEFKFKQFDIVTRPLNPNRVKKDNKNTKQNQQQQQQKQQTKTKKS